MKTVAWKTSKTGDPYFAERGVTLTIYDRHGAFVWRATSWDRDGGFIEAEQPFLTEEHAKEAGLKALSKARRQLRERASVWSRP